ncbi:MAG: SEC-C domain-containing protein [Cellvibrionaceae bacterium]|nr:SEC-C domain-containing protein [Cellvibrionaceae bacterium]
MDEQWDIPGLEQYLAAEYDLSLPLQQWLDEDDRLHEDTLREKILAAAQTHYQQKCERLGEALIEIEKQVMLQILDMQWKEHLLSMDHLRQGIGLRAYAQKNPKQEYKRESFELFQALLVTIKEETIRILARVEPVTDEQMAAMERRQRLEQARAIELQHEQVPSLDQSPPASQQPPSPPAEQPYIRQDKKVGRNQPCPCGSGKKYKQCCGKL